MAGPKKEKDDQLEDGDASGSKSVRNVESGSPLDALTTAKISGWPNVAMPNYASLISTPVSSWVSTPMSSLVTSQSVFSSPTISSLAYTPASSLVYGVGDYTKIGLWSDKEFLNSVKSFDDEVVELKKQVESQALAISKQKNSTKAKEGQIAELKESIEELNAKIQLGFLLGRVNAAAQRELLNSDKFREQFVQPVETPAIVMSVDIRRSTELMLKARRPQAFADFVTTLCADMMRIITDHFGVFDKFTGDGVLAFFPEFYSGPDAAFYAVEAADKCHASFRQHYQQFRTSFTSVLTDTGLGIGLDYGPVHLVQIAGGLTVVGAPVVYACRLASAPPNITLANQPAYEILSERSSSICFIEERTLEIKHEGPMLAYAVRRNSREYTPELPSWLKESSSSTKG
jgi:class 3 adenylate cyclase